MNPALTKLNPYPFERLRKLFSDAKPNPDLAPISLSIGEPKHSPPSFILDAIAEYRSAITSYPPTKGDSVLRGACAKWLESRFELPETTVNPNTQVLPLNGTREGLFGIAQACIDSSKNQALVITPNPFYQIYEGAAILAGAQPYFLDTSQELGAQIDAIPTDVWARCQLMYFCSPSNPTGRVADLALWTRIMHLALEHDFVLVADECYSEIYLGKTPPPGLLQACYQAGNTEFRQCVVMHSLSKRSNVPGLRSGFVAGDAEILSKFLQYRTYCGGAMPPMTQHVSALAWQDEDHVHANRHLYQEKFSACTPILEKALTVTNPEGGFYYWQTLPLGDEEFAKELYRQKNVAVLPGSYLARSVAGCNPGENHARISLVAPLSQCIEACERITDFFC